MLKIARPVVVLTLIVLFSINLPAQSPNAGPSQSPTPAVSKEKLLALKYKIQALSRDKKFGELDSLFVSASSLQDQQAGVEIQQDIASAICSVDHERAVRYFTEIFERCATLKVASISVGITTPSGVQHNYREPSARQLAIIRMTQQSGTVGDATECDRALGAKLVADTEHTVQPPPPPARGHVAMNITIDLAHAYESVVARTDPAEAARFLRERLQNGFDPALSETLCNIWSSDEVLAIEVFHEAIAAARTYTGPPANARVALVSVAFKITDDSNRSQNQATLQREIRDSQDFQDHLRDLAGEISAKPARRASAKLRNEAMRDFLEYMAPILQNYQSDKLYSSELLTTTSGRTFHEDDMWITWFKKYLPEKLEIAKAYTAWRREWISKLKQMGSHRVDVRGTDGKPGKDGSSPIR